MPLDNNMMSWIDARNIPMFHFVPLMLMLHESAAFKSNKSGFVPWFDVYNTHLLILRLSGIYRNIHTVFPYLAFGLGKKIQARCSAAVVAHRLWEGRARL
jgi:hypothetical protein